MEEKSKFVVIGDYRISQNENGSIRVSIVDGRDGEIVCPNTMEALCDIAEDIDFQYSKDWNTRQLGRSLIRYVSDPTLFTPRPVLGLPENYVPSLAKMRAYHAKWHKMADYVAQEAALDRLFILDPSTRPNTDMSVVMIKCAVLNDFYSTNIYKVHSVARKICGIKNLDARLADGDLSLVDEIADVDGRRNYSFATKYCSHHQPSRFPIYDRYVDRVLRALSGQHKEMPDCGDLRDYPHFVDVVDSFMDIFHFAGKTYKDVDRYLWLLGRECFNAYKKTGEDKS